MIHHPKLVSAAITAGGAEHHFSDDHVHMLLLVDDSQLIGTLIRTDLQKRPALF